MPRCSSITQLHEFVCLQVGRPVDLTATLALRGAPLALPNTLTLKISNQQAAGDVSVGSKTATNIALPQTLSATYTGPAAPGEQKFQAIAVLETTGTMQASTPNVVKSAVAAVTFVAAPTTTLSTPTTNPTLGDDSTIKAILTNGPGGLPLGDATVTFTLTQPDGKQVLYTFKTGRLFPHYPKPLCKSLARLRQGARYATMP